ncbi:MAG: DUF1295 domain-containing protein [Lachnospiraceae bacterium]|jgi:steroid 5-alpha reductase family enzyme
MRRLKRNRIFSFVVIILAYITATVTGVWITSVMNGQPWVKILVADIVATIILFIFSSIFSNSSIYTPYWSVKPIVIVIGMALGTKLTLLRFLLIFAICVWGARLTFNWVSRFRSLRYEDWRYIRFRRIWGPLFPVINFLGIHLFPSMIVYTCMLPVISAFTFEADFSIFSLPFFFIALSAAFMEAYADYHMTLWKKDVADGYATGCCRYGMWKHARHPNYLGEILFWWAIYLTVILTYTNKWHLFYGALSNTLMFVFVSIPLAESRLSNKPGYRRYKAQTRLLLPIRKGRR